MDTLILDFSAYSWATAKNIFARVDDANEIDMNQEIMVKVVRAIPREWLVTDAPAALDWSAIDSYDWLQQPRMKSLLAAIQRGEGLPDVGSPIFSFERFSWGMARKNQAALEALEERIQANDVTALLELFDVQQRTLAKTVISIPREWLAADAPKAIDWGNPASFDYLQAPRFKQLQEAFAVAQDNATKN